MKKLHDTFQRFCYRHPRFGVANLMRYIVIGNAAVYLLMMFSQMNNSSALDFLMFSWYHVLRGELWRLVTFVFVPDTMNLFYLVIGLYFYYWIGSSLERQWGTAKFCAYYFSGVLLTVLGAALASVLTGHNVVVSGATYVNLSMFLAFAVLFPDVQVLLFFIIPVKMKWLAWLDGGLFALNIVRSAIAGSWGGVVLPAVALLNFAVFVFPEVKYLTERTAYRYRPQAINFKKSVKEQQENRGYHHKCCVCGRTDADSPELEFRYCSKCAGYHCFCQDHIFTHIHFTQ